MNSVFRTLALRIQNISNGYDPSAYGPERSFSNPALYPIFIIGAPRTGSTLLYQLMINSMQLAFISNLMALLPKKMLLIAKRTVPQMRRIKHLQESDLGYIPGLFSPNEAGAIMRAWFEAEVNNEEKKVIRNTVIMLSEIFGSPFMSKNLFNSLRLAHIRQVLPEARFIYIRRNPLFTAQSILLARRELGDEQQWLGPKPTNSQLILEKSPLYQALWQVKQIEEAVTEFLREYTPIHLEVTYETLSQNTEETLKLITNEFELKCNCDDIERLSVRERIRLGESEWQQLVENYSTLYY